MLSNALESIVITSRNPKNNRNVNEWHGINSIQVPVTEIYQLRDSLILWQLCQFPSVTEKCNKFYATILFITKIYVLLCNCMLLLRNLF